MVAEPDYAGHLKMSWNCLSKIECKEIEFFNAESRTSIYANVRNSYSDYPDGGYTAVSFVVSNEVESCARVEFLLLPMRAGNFSRIRADFPARSLR